MRPRHLTSAALALALAASTLTATVLSASPAAASHAAAAAAPDVHAKLVKGGLNDPAGFTFTPKGWIYYAERGTGEIHVLNPSTGKGHLFFKVRGVNGSGERGALGVALDPSSTCTRPAPRTGDCATRSCGSAPRVARGLVSA